MSFGVINRGNEYIDSMIKRFKKKQKNNNFIDDIQRNRFFISKSEKRNRVNQRNKFIKKKVEQENEKSNFRL